MKSKRDLDRVMQTVCNWGNQFIKTHYFEALTEEQKEDSVDVVLSFAEHMYGNYRLSPEKWNESKLERCCLHLLPEIMVVDDSYFTSIAPVLSAFFEFLAERGFVSQGHDLARKIREIDQEIVEKGLDPANWNIGKLIFMAGIDEGVDVTDEKEREEFLKEFTKGPYAGYVMEKVLDKKRKSSRISKKDKQKKMTKELRKEKDEQEDMSKEVQKKEKQIVSLHRWLEPQEMEKLDDK